MNLGICHIGSRSYVVSGCLEPMSGIGESRNEVVVRSDHYHHHVPGAGGQTKSTVTNEEGSSRSGSALERSCLHCGSVGSFPGIILSRSFGVTKVVFLYHRPSEYFFGDLVLVYAIRITHTRLHRTLFIRDDNIFSRSTHNLLLQYISYTLRYTAGTPRCGRVLFEMKGDLKRTRLRRMVDKLKINDCVY